MIRTASRDDLYSLDTSSPFLVRILSLYESYGEGYDFVSFWVQESGGALTSAVSRFEDRFSLYLTPLSDLEEISLFLGMSGGASVLFDSSYALNIPSKKYIGGDVMKYSGQNDSLEELTEPGIKEEYDLLLSCSADDFIVPDYMMFLSDVTHRKNQGKCTILGLYEDGVLVSSAMTVSETDSAVILGAVATRPGYRRRGLSRRVVRALAGRFSHRGRHVFVLSAKEENTRFYQHTGFDVVAGFREIFT